MGGATINMAEQQEADESLYCVCRRPYAEEDEEFMIECEVCRDWFHGRFVSLLFHLPPTVSFPPLAVLAFKSIK